MSKNKQAIPNNQLNSLLFFADRFAFSFSALRAIIFFSFSAVLNFTSSALILCSTSRVFILS